MPSAFPLALRRLRDPGILRVWPAAIVAVRARGVWAVPVAGDGGKMRRGGRGRAERARSFGGGPPLLAVAVNAVALGRDLREMVAARHMASVALKAEPDEMRGVRLGVGLVAALLFVVPVVNLIAPVLGAATAMHRYHRRRR